jgi:uncharacterized phage protein (TIGR02218 family)
MRAASSAVINYINNIRPNPDAIAYIADCYTFTLATGLVLTYTNADVPVTLNGYIYLANSILVNGLKYKCTTGLEVDQQKITISAKTTDTLSAGLPFLQAIGQGVLDGAEIQRERVFLNSWSPTDTVNPVGSVILFKGRVGTVDSIGRTSAEITVNSDLVLLDIKMPRRIYSPACQHVLYDSGCGLLKSAFGTNGTVGAGSTQTNIFWTGAGPNYDQGTITFSSGVNTGISATIKSNVPGSYLILAYPLYVAPSTGDEFTAYWGCDHTKTTCQNKFNNLANFLGFPFVPRQTYTLF